MDDLAVLRQYIEIAESQDSQRDAWVKAADALEHRKRATGQSNPELGAEVDRSKDWVSKVLAWRASGYIQRTPFTDGGNAPRAATSHTRKVLRERPVDVAPEIAKALEDPEVQREVIAASPRVASNMMATQVQDGLERVRTHTLSREEIDDRQGFNDLPAPMLSPWDPFWQQVVPGMREVMDRMHEDVWNLPPEMVRAISEKTAELSVVLGGLAAAAREATPNS